MIDAAMRAYFAGEQTGGLVLVAMGVGGLIAGALLFRRGTAVARGASYLVLAMGLVHAAAGGFVYVSSDRRVEKLTRELAADPAAFADREAARMRGVSTQFQVLEVVEVVLIAGGLTMAVIGRRGRPRLHGAGLALVLEAAATLAFDVSAAARAHRYREALAASSEPASSDRLES